MDTARIDPTLLPPSAKRLVRVIGWDRTWALLESWGGQRIALHDHGHREVWALLGAERIRTLRAEFGAAVELPRATLALRRAHHAAMRAARADGATYNQLAGAFGCTRRTAINVCGPASNDETDPAQPDLFGPDGQ